MTDHERDALDVRPTADEMLARIGGEASTGRGRLRVYLGMAPGVGRGADGGVYGEKAASVNRG